MKKVGIAAFAAVLLLATACGGDGGQKTGGTAALEESGNIEKESLQPSLEEPQVKRLETDRGGAGEGETERAETPETEMAEAEITESGAETANAEMLAKYRAALEQFDWSRGPWYLEDVGDCLNRQSLPWEGYYNQTGERVDIQLKDGSRLILLDITDDYGDYAGMVLIMAGDKFNDSAFQEGYLCQYDVTSEEEYYPQTRYSLLSEEELERMNQTDLSIARNEIYARHGRRYEDPFLKAVFTRKSWYEPEYSGEEFRAREAELLNSIEMENLKMIVAREEELGCRQKEGDTSVRLRALANGSSPDLDGDGYGETVYLDLHYSAPGRGDAYELFVYGKYSAESMETRRMDWVQPAVYTGSLDRTSTLLFVCRKEEENPPMTDVYKYQDEKLQYCGMIAGNQITIKDGCLYAHKERERSQAEGELVKYIMQDGQVKEVPVN